MMKLIFIEFNFISSIPITIFFLVLIIILLGIYLYYRRTLPALNHWDKIFLALMRLMALVTIILSVGEFAVESKTKKIEDPVTAILIDNSKSVSNDQSLIRDKLEKIIHQLNKEKQKIEIFTFDQNVRKINLDSLLFINFNGYLTNISSAINEIIKNKTQKNYQNVILITDGIYNSGENPIYSVEKSEIPFLIFGVGDPNPKIDVSIDNIVTNDLIYAQNQTPVRVNIKSNGLENQQITITFHEDNKLLEKRNFILHGNYQEIEFSYTPQTEGEKKLNFSISPINGEYTRKNNFASKYVNVLSNKIRILVIAGKPSYDLSFINQAIKFNPDFRLETLIEKPDESFYPLLNNEKFVDSADVIFIIGFPTAHNSERFIKKIYSKIQNDNIPIFILINPDTDFNRLSLFKPFLPFNWQSPFGTASQIFIDVPEDKNGNEILNISSENSVKLWNSFPPIHRVDREFFSKPESEILAFYKIGNNRINQPLIITRNLNKHRSIAFLGFNLWRLKLLNALKEEESIYFDKFINNSVKWLSSKEIEKNLSVKVSKKIFDVNEKINIIAQLYNDSNFPLSDEQINLEIFKKENKVISTQFKPLGNGIYSAEIDNLDEGDYSFQAMTEFSGKKYSDNGKFSVNETETEFRDLTLREDLLKRISEYTKGSYVHISKADPFIENLNHYLIKRQKVGELSKIFHVWNSIYTLVLIIFFLSLEWFLRKRWGLL